MLGRARCMGSMRPEVFPFLRPSADLPPHSFMRHMHGRDLDRTSRGLGGTRSVPLTSVGEENLLMEGDE